MKRSVWYIFSFVLVQNFVAAQKLEPFELTQDWISKIEKMAPAKTRIRTNEVKKILIFSLHTGYKHWVIPHTEAALKIVATKSQAFEVVTSYDIKDFERKNLKKYDAIILNNNCSIGDKRNLFWDKLKEDSLLLNEKQRAKKAKQLEKNLLKYIKKGHGLMLLHGAITMQNKSMDFSTMVGGSFDYHPKQQKIHVKLVDVKHPLTQVFSVDGFVHTDEPYFFNNAYFDYNFRPLLYIEANELEGLKKKVNDNVKYISWIKKYGKGRVFFSSPAHNAQSFENPQMLQYFLDGMQYVVGDLHCDDSPMKNSSK